MCVELDWKKGAATVQSNSASAWTSYNDVVYVKVCVSVQVPVRDRWTSRRRIQVYVSVMLVVSTVRALVQSQRVAGSGPARHIILLVLKLMAHIHNRQPFDIPGRRRKHTRRSWLNYLLFSFVI